MAKKRNRGITRREMIKATGVAGLAAGIGPAFLFPERALAQQKTLKICQWSHFVPAWDTWFNGTYTKQWGQANNCNVVVDNINLTELKTRASSEISAQKGHDLFMLLSPPAAYENQVVDMTHVYQEVEKKHGKKIPLAHRATYNPKTKKYFAFSDAYTPDPGNWHKDWWTEAGYPNGPDTYDDLLNGARKIRKADKSGPPCGLGLAQELDTSMAMRAILWSFGGAEQDEAGNVTINSKNTIEALKYMKALFQETETAEVFTWTPPSNNQAMLAGKVSYVANSISRQAEREHNPLDSKIMVSRALKGPVRRIAAEHVMNCYVVWNFAEEKDLAQKFLIDWMDHFHEGFVAGQFYNFPCFPSTVPDLQKEIATDPRATPPDKYKVLGDVLDWATNVGYPGYATAAIDEAFTTWVIPTMFAKVARGDETPENAAKAAEEEYKRIFARFK
jgi:multiple sugar transport system substrate-binding protein